MKLKFDSLQEARVVDETLVNALENLKQETKKKLIAKINAILTL